MVESGRAMDVFDLYCADRNEGGVSTQFLLIYDDSSPK